MDPKRIKKYQPYPSVDLIDRQWPNRRIVTSPQWCSVDLRDGNQALANPMSLEQKSLMFELLIEIGFKEIEVGFPSASDVEYQFIRHLIENNLIPDDVTIQVLTPAIASLIERTCDAIVGAKSVIVQLYLSTSKVHREIVLKKSQSELMEMAVQATTTLQQSLALRQQSARFLFSPENFTDSELEFVVSICDAVVTEWRGEEPVLINLPATVERSTPNVFADRVEWFDRHLLSRNRVILSVHTHNDRGTAVAATELALLAGAERVEGTLFGNGERAGNVDLVTLALNLYSQGVDPKLNLQDINHIISVSDRCTLIPPHPRHPYVGDLIFTAFSGTHQDAIIKGMAALSAPSSDQVVWQVPYLSIDPSDIGRTNEALIRINSQSGKAAIAYILETEFGCKIPREMRPELAALVQSHVNHSGVELSSTNLWRLFRQVYLTVSHPLALISFNGVSIEDDLVEATIVVRHQDQKQELTATNSGLIDACMQAVLSLYPHCSVVNCYQQSLKKEPDSELIVYLQVTDSERACFGAGIDTSMVGATVKALVSAVNRLSQMTSLP